MFIKPHHLQHGFAHANPVLVGRATYRSAPLSLGTLRFGDCFTILRGLISACSSAESRRFEIVSGFWDRRGSSLLFAMGRHLRDLRKTSFWTFLVLWRSFGRVSRYIFRLNLPLGWGSLATGSIKDGMHLGVHGYRLIRSVGGFEDLIVAGPLMVETSADHFSTFYDDGSQSKGHWRLRAKYQDLVRVRGSEE